MKLNILVTGATGFVGSSLAKSLAGHNLFLLTHTEAADKNLSAAWVTQDLTKPLRLAELPKELDIIIHEAAKVGRDVAEGDDEAWRVNIEATRQLLEYGKKARITKFIYASTSAVYGYNQNPSTEETSPYPLNYYAKTKLEAEKIVKKYSSYFETLIFRYFYPYGPGQRRGLQKIISRVLLKEPVIIYNQGENPKTNPIYIDDLVRLTIKSFGLKGSHVINMGGPEIASIKEITEIAAGLLGKKPVYDFREDKSVSNEIGDISRMKELLGTPETHLKEGLRMVLLENTQGKFKS
ncbi:MAG: hypothetical protein A2Z42_03445 [Candidatus Woykebacteria bacterium RBG_19FT_COMBO_43_10]|uniref:NAD-dependent epimerase/dehydratase domain-containing protein n=1 Tax=Candidatus Woykebacteria bacterium RBG_19FT_COMBO_43_10 TaxID=1802598 RepID=A0A1G1WF85_9BACT|nr:MAG: hypothetical protein A2Z42_03445 [Candidatus Woykebacteria bacterium RBG_19FT_COMBO_43_10]